MPSDSRLCARLSAAGGVALLLAFGVGPGSARAGDPVTTTAAPAAPGVPSAATPTAKPPVPPPRLIDLDEPPPPRPPTPAAHPAPSAAPDVGWGPPGFPYRTPPGVAGSAWYGKLAVSPLVAPPGTFEPGLYVTVPPGPPTRRKSVPMVITGAALATGGLVTFIAGVALFAMAPGRIDIYCDNPTPNLCGNADDTGLAHSGVAAMVLGLAGVAAGIPLIAIGAKHVPITPADAKPSAWVAPELRAGPGGASVSWRFW